MLKLLINNGNGPVDYTQYVIPSSITITDSINTPTLFDFTLTNTNGAFQAPVRSAYVQLVSTISPLSTTGANVITGFITNAPTWKYLGLGQRAGIATSFQHYELAVTVTSDEYLLNIKSVPFIAAFVNQTMGQILTNIANDLAPGYFNTAGIQDGDLIPYYSYDPTKKWSDVAKAFADQAQFRYKAINKHLFFFPYGDQPLGVIYDETTQLDSQFVPGSLDTTVMTVALVNDALVTGDVEPQQNHSDYFVGDGFTGSFPLRYSLFHGATNLLLQDDWTENAFSTQYWNVQDFSGQFVLTGALNAIPVSGTTQSYILGQNGVELGGHLTLQHGEFQFNDPYGSTGIVGGLYSTDSSLTQATCIAGFDLRNVAPIPFPTWQASTVVQIGYEILDTSGNIQMISAVSGAQITGTVQPNWASELTLGSTIQDNQVTWTLVAQPPLGQAGVQMTPIFNGALVGTPVISQFNHHYVLQTYISAGTWSRYNQTYRTLAGNAWGNEQTTANANVTFTITDIDLAQAYNIATLRNPFVPAYVPVVTTYTAQNVSLPSFAAYAILNTNLSNNSPTLALSLTVNYTAIFQPPQGHLRVQSLTGAQVRNPLAITGGLQPPWDPNDPLAEEIGQELQPYQDYALGFGLGYGPIATIPGGGAGGASAGSASQTGFDTLEFYSDTIPGVGARVEFQAWQAGTAVARVQDPTSIASEAALVGDNGLRSAVFNDLQPAPRTSYDCDLAAAATIADREQIQYQGSYTVESYFYDPYYEYPRTGRYLNINSPARGIGTTLSPGVSGTQPVQINAWGQVNVSVNGTYSIPNVTEGNFMLLHMEATTGSLPSVTVQDTMGNDWVNFYSDGSTNFYYAFVNATGTNSLVFSSATSFGSMEWLYFEVTNVRGYIGVVTTPGIGTVKGQIGDTKFSFAGTGTLLSVQLIGPNMSSITYSIFDEALDGATPNLPGWVALPELQGGTPQSEIEGYSYSIGQITTEEFLVTSVKTTVLELKQEILKFEIDFGMDLYLEKLLRRFIAQPQGVAGLLESNDTAVAPNPQNLPAPVYSEGIFTTYLPNLDNAKATTITGTQVLVDVGVTPVTGIEVRRGDIGWASNTQNLYGIFTTQTFTLPRSNFDQQYFMRMVNGSKTSRFTKVIRTTYPLVPQAPSSILIDTTNVYAPVLTVKLPTSFDRNIYGVQIDSGYYALDFPSQVCFSSDSASDKRIVQIIGTGVPASSPFIATLAADSGQTLSASAKAALQIQIAANTDSLTDFVQLNGTTPVCTTDWFVTIDLVTAISGLILSDDGEDNWQDGFSYAFNSMTLTQNLADFTGQYWQDSLSLAFTPSGLSDSLNSPWQDSISLASGLSLVDTLKLNDSLIIGIGIGPADAQGDYFDSVSFRMAGSAVIQLRIVEKMQQNDLVAHS